MSNLPTTSVHFDQTPLYAEGSTHVASSKVCERARVRRWEGGEGKEGQTKNDRKGGKKKASRVLNVSDYKIGLLQQREEQATVGHLCRKRACAGARAPRPVFFFPPLPGLFFFFFFFFCISTPPRVFFFSAQPHVNLGQILRATTNVQQAMGFSAEDLASIMPHYVSFSFPSDTSLVRHHLFTVRMALKCFPVKRIRLCRSPQRCGRCAHRTTLPTTALASTVS